MGRCFGMKGSVYERKFRNYWLRRFCAYCGDGLRDGETKCHKCGQENE